MTSGVNRYSTITAVLFAAVAAFAFSFAIDLLIGGLVGVYSSNVYAATVTWSVGAAVLTWAAVKIRGRRGWLAVPFFIIAVAACIGAVVGAHPHNWGVAAAMIVLTIAVRRYDAGPFNSIVESRPQVFGWDPAQHSSEDSFRWCWLRAVEWGRWPVFVSQPIAPVLLIWWRWQAVVAIAFIANLIWARFFRYRGVSTAMASGGVLFVAGRWVTWPSATAFMFYHHMLPEAWVAVAWPLLIFPIGAYPRPEIGRIQSMFIHNLGCTK
jgi:hypothetical protein